MGCLVRPTGRSDDDDVCHDGYADAVRRIGDPALRQRYIAQLDYPLAILDSDRRLLQMGRLWRGCDADERQRGYLSQYGWSLVEYALGDLTRRAAYWSLDYCLHVVAIRRGHNRLRDVRLSHRQPVVHQAGHRCDELGGWEQPVRQRRAQPVRHQEHYYAYQGRYAFRPVPVESFQQLIKLAHPAQTHGSSTN